MTIRSQILEEIRSDLGIYKGSTESVESLKCRTIYSAIGRLAYSSLWDETDETDQNDESPDSNNKPSIIYFKRRAEKSFNAYTRLFPEIVPYYIEDAKELADSFFEQFEMTGQLYHSAYRVSPPIKSMANENGVTFVRGFSPFEDVYVSGLGSFIKSESSTDLTVREMFNIPIAKPCEQWDNIIRKANFSPILVDDKFEFLNLNITSGGHYWVNKSSLVNCYSLMRTTDRNNRLYYLYKNENGNFLSSQLPDFLIANSEYQTLANGCLLSQKKLPKSTYHLDGSIVALNIGYLFPPSVQNFIMLYSWPANFKNIKGGFNRIVSANIFPAIKQVVENCGFEFMEV